MKRPRLVVTLCFVGAMALVTLVGLHQLYNFARSDLQNCQRDLEVRAVGVDALIDTERRHLVALRNYLRARRAFIATRPRCPATSRSLGRSARSWKSATRQTPCAARWPSSRRTACS
ncbi:hypothetical protein PWR63_33940 [Paraburkholderia sp. A2WS-5]|uniref:hypothetical protein n=1 Tax=unclassified Paraburkholderia TaxID=2615204 RepID=UPI003B786A31